MILWTIYVLPTEEADIKEITIYSEKTLENSDEQFHHRQELTLMILFLLVNKNMMLLNIIHKR